MGPNCPEPNLSGTVFVFVFVFVVYALVWLCGCVVVLLCGCMPWCGCMRGRPGISREDKWVVWSHKKAGCWLCMGWAASRLVPTQTHAFLDSPWSFFDPLSQALHIGPIVLVSWRGSCHILFLSASIHETHADPCIPRQPLIFFWPSFTSPLYDGFRTLAPPRILAPYWPNSIQRCKKQIELTQMKSWPLKN